MLVPEGAAGMLATAAGLALVEIEAMGVVAVLVERAELAGKAAMADALSLAFPRRLSRDARPMGTPEQRALMERIEETV